MAEEAHEAAPLFARTDSSHSFRRLCSSDLEAKLDSPSGSLEDSAGNMSPSLAALKGAKMHVKSKWHDETKLLPFRRVKSVPSLLPECPAHRADGYDAGNNEKQESEEPQTSDEYNASDSIPQRKMLWRPFPSLQSDGTTKVDPDVAVHGMQPESDDEDETSNADTFARVETSTPRGKGTIVMLKRFFTF